MQAEYQILHPHYRGTCDLKGSVKTGQVCHTVCVCVLLLISYTTRFGATVKQRVERSCYDIPNVCGDFRKTS